MNITNLKLWKVGLVGLVFLAILGLSIFFSIKYHSAYKNALQSLEQAEQNIRIYGITVDDLKETVYESRIAIVETQRQLSLSRAQAERLKAQNIRKVQVIGELELSISSYRDSLLLYKKVDTVYYPVGVEQTVDGAMLPLPVSFGSQDDWLTQQAVINERGLGSISFELEPVKLDVTLGSRGLWNKSYIAAISTDNPHVAITQNEWSMIDPKKKATPYILVGTLDIAVGGVVTLFLLGL